MFLLLLALVGGCCLAQQTFSEQEQAALDELRQAGLLEADVEAILEAIEEDYDLKEQDEAEDRGGPRRRRRPSSSKRKGGGGSRQNALQALASFYAPIFEGGLSSLAPSLRS